MNQRFLQYSGLLAALLTSQAVSAQGPGGVPVKAWYRADVPGALFSDAGVTPAGNNTNVYQWNEASGTSFHLLQATAANRPVFSNASVLANFNPTVTYDGSNDWMQYSPATGIDVIDRANGTLFVAGYVNVQKRSGFAGFHATMDYPGLHSYAGTNNLLFFTGGPGYQGQSTVPMTAQSYFTAGTGWQNGAGASSSYAAATVSLNGVSASYSGSQLNNVNLAATARDFRVGSDNNYGAFSGQLNEVLVFEDRLSAAQQAQVESYLAIKFGTTYAAGLQDYKSAAGVTVWNAATNAAYNKNIAGVASDGDLQQKQAWSTNAGTQVLIATTGLANTNATNATALSAGQYLIWGDNGLLKTPSVAIAGIAGISHRFAAIWRVQNTGAVGTVRVAWPKNLSNLSLIQSTDNIFTSADVVTAMTGNEITIGGTTYNYADVTLADGSYFTFAAKVAAPGGVSGPAVWLKADAGTTLNGTSVNGWTNYGNSGGVAGQLAKSTTVNWALPKYGANEHNFNPAIIDDVAGNNNGSLLLADVFPASGHRALNSFVLQSHTNLSSHHNMIAYTPLKQTDGALEAPYMGGYTSASSRPWFFWEGRYEVAPTYPNALVKYSNIPAVNAFYVPQFVPGTPHTVTFGMNGATVNGNTYNSSATTYPFGNQLFIFGDGNANNSSGGKISEVITYDKVLTTTERQQVNSYLAVKYGITLTNDAGTTAMNYLNSSAVTVWDAATNNGYNKNIGGIANDLESMLNQKQSKSVNAGQQVLIGTSGLGNTNALNTSSLANGQYLIWGDNGLARVPAEAITGVAGVNFRFAAVWKVQNTGTVGSVRVAWPVGLTNLTLVQSTDPSFASVSSAHGMSGNVTTINGVVYNYVDATLTNGNYFTFATQLNGPGGVALDLRVWLRSDAGFTPEQWSDLSGNTNNYTQTNASRQPFVAGKQYNFNPIVDFGTTGADARFMVVPAGKPYTANGTSSTLFTAGTSKTSGGYSDVIGFGATTTGTGLTNANAPTFTKLGNNLVLYPYTTVPALPSVVLNRLYLDDVSYTVGVNGIKYGQNGQVATTAQTFAAGNALYANGSILGAQPEERDGFIGEVIAYQRDLTEAEKQRVRSYVAIKYGITLPHDYIAANGSTIFWSQATNTGFNSNIAGIVRDDYGSLSQKQSRSTNAGSQVLISTTGLTHSNATNTAPLNDQQFLLWGDNNRAKGPAVAITGIADVNYRFAAIWKVQNTNSMGTVRVAWPKGFANLKLIRSTDTVFDASDVVTDMTDIQTVDGTDYVYADVTLSNGGYFTFAAYIQAPGGVANNLSYWYRADKYAEANGAGTDVVSWTDFTSGTVTEALGDNDVPLYREGDSTYLNFNPGINFTTVDQSLGNLSARTFNNSAYDVFMLTKENITSGGNGRIFSSLIDNSLQAGSINYWDAFGDMADSRTERLNVPQGYRYLATIGGSRPTTHSSIVYHNLMNTTTGKAINGAVVTTSTAHTAIGLPNGGHAFGSTQFLSNGSDNAGFTGNIGEAVIYGNGNVTPAERNKVESYLAIKYGITLSNTNNYTTSQDVIVWDATANAGFYNNVAGIGKDDISALEQKQSRSQMVSAGNQVTMAVGDIATTNMANPNSLSNGQFLVWGDNGNSTMMSNTAGTFTAFSYGGGNNNSRRMNRIWKVQNTSISSSLKIRYPRSSVGSTTLPAGDACGTYAIIFASDAAFTTNVTVVALDTTENGTYYEAMHAFPAGASYFSFGKVTPLKNGTAYLPPVVENTTAYNTNCNVGEWVHYTKTSDATLKMLGLAGYITTELNNLAVTITPEGTSYDDGSRTTQIMPRISTVTNNNVGAISSGKVRVYFSQAEQTASMVPGAQTNGWFKYEGSADDVLADIYNDGVFDAAKAAQITPAVTGTEDGVAYVEFHNVSSFSSFVYLSSSEIVAVVLPVTFLSFEATVLNKHVQLNWVTADERNNRGFDVQRSADGRNWQNLGFVSGLGESGNSAGSLTYADMDPLPGKNFYRIRQNDLDGKVTYSHIRKVVLHAADNTVALYPNPARDEVLITGLTLASELRIFDNQGRVLLQTRLAKDKQVIDISKLAPGLYIVYITDDQGNQHKIKLVKSAN